jgi:hypothetical protein
VQGSHESVLPPSCRTPAGPCAPRGAGPHVQTQCKQFARQNHEYGFWGGESEEERHLAGYTVAAPIGVRARAGLN